MNRFRPLRSPSSFRLAIPGITTVLAVTLVLVGCGEDNNKKLSETPAPSTTNSLPSNDSQYPTKSPTPADNTAKNTRDDGTTTTPFDQGTSPTDIAITQSARKSVVSEKNMSVNGQNIKIITKDGVMMLRGPVASEAERNQIVALLQNIDGVRVVKNYLEITAH
jgi:hyperosmotically inducible periplasmic protein